MAADPTSFGRGSDGAVRPRRRILRLLPIALVVALIVAALATGAADRLRFDTLLDHWESVTAFVADHPLQASLGFMGAFVAFVVASLPGVSLFGMTSGLLFGWLLGGAMAVVSATAGAILVFLAARTAFGAALARRSGSLLGRIAAGFRRDAFNYLLFLRLVPGFPFWLVNLAPALLGVPFRTYVAGTVLGVLPTMYAFASIGAGLETFITQHAAERAACLATGDLDCHIGFQPAALMSTATVIGLVTLAVTALVPILLRRRAGAGAVDAV